MLAKISEDFSFFNSGWKSFSYPCPKNIPIWFEKVICKNFINFFDIHNRSDLSISVLIGLLIYRLLVPCMTTRTIIADDIVRSDSSLKAVYRFSGKNVKKCNQPENHLF